MQRITQRTLERILVQADIHLGVPNRTVPHDHLIHHSPLT
jgi:hypothetical protein